MTSRQQYWCKLLRPICSAISFVVEFDFSPVSQWDPMITTLPGLYLSSIGIYQPLSRLFGVSMQLLCSTFWLRSINVLFTVGNALVMRFLLQTLHKTDKARFVVATFPRL